MPPRSLLAPQPTDRVFVIFFAISECTIAKDLRQILLFLEPHFQYHTFRVVGLHSLLFRSSAQESICLRHFLFSVFCLLFFVCPNMFHKKQKNCKAEK